MKQIFYIYFLIINIVTFAVFAFDKFSAIKKGPRIKEKTLFGLIIIGGSLGGLLSMSFFRHKTQKIYFTVGVFLIMTIQAALIYYLFN